MEAKLLKKYTVTSINKIPNRKIQQPGENSGFMTYSAKIAPNKHNLKSQCQSHIKLEKKKKIG